jgi:CRISPR/Cas system-associated exonuclease Cas4 (RecB family)
MHNPFQDIDQRIWESFVHQPREKRNYIGASIVGHSCDRRIWLEWKGYVNSKEYIEKEKLGQKYEIFHRGKLEEEIFIKKLEKIGYTVKDRQAEFSLYDGKLQGHCDGIIVDDQGFEYMFEFKTMMETTFNSVKKWKLEKAHIHYLYQIQLYMNFINFKSDQECKKALIICQNKNKDWERYQELHRLNPQMIQGVLAKIERIFSYEEDMPGTISPADNPSYICKMCEYFKFCYPEVKV